MALMLPGCAVLSPLVQDFNIVPLSQEKELGDKMEAQIAQQMPVAPADSELDKQINRIGARLIEPLTGTEIFMSDDSPNAFAIPGGSIYIHTGLIQFAQSEAELAGVMAHEIGHVYERHPAKSVSRQYGLQQLAGVLLPENANKLQTMAAQFASGGILNKYGRDDEREADEIGYYVMKKAGYDPRGLLRFFERLQKATGGSSTPAFFRSHPPTPERIQRLEALISQGEESIQFKDTRELAGFLSKS